MAGKAEIRRLIRGRLAAFTASAIAEKSERICEAIARQPAWIQASLVCLFAPQPTEPDVELLWAKIGGRQFCYPRVNGAELDLIRVAERASLETSRWQLREPLHDVAKVVSPESIDLILVPGLAFSPAGGRLGRG